MNWFRYLVGGPLGLALVAVAVAFGPPPVQAATFWWNTTTTGSWADGANWDNAASGGTSGTAPANDTTTDTVVFNRTATNGNEIVTLSADTSIAGLTFSNRGATTLRSDSATTRTFSIGGSGLSLGSAAGPVTIGVSGNPVNVSLAADQSWTNNASPVSSSLTVAGGISSAGGSTTLTIDGGGATTLSGAITDGSGTVAVTKSGTGILTLSGANTYSGNTAINAGTVVINATNSLAGATTVGRYTVASGATLAVNNGVNDTDIGNILATGNFSAGSLFGFNTAAGTRTYANAITGGIGLAKLGINTLSLSGTSDYTDLTSVRGGTLQLTTLAGGKLTSTSGVAVADATLFIGDSTAANNNGVSDRINPAAGLTLGSSLGTSTLTLGASTTSHSQTFASLASIFGRSVVGVSATGGTNTLTFTGAGGAGYTRATGGYLNIATQTGFSVAFTNDPTVAGGSAVSGSGTDKILVGATINGNDLVGLSGSGPYSTGTAVYVDSGTTTWTADKNMNVTGAISPAATTVNAIRFAVGSNRTVTLTGTNVINSGMILMASTGATTNTPGTITGGTITSGNGQDLVIVDQRSVGNRDGVNAFLVNSTIADDGATPIAVTLVGNNNGMVRLGGTNAYSGGTNLVGANLRLISDAGLGAVPASPATNIRAVGNSQIGIVQAGTTSLHANRGIDFSGQLLLDPQFANNEASRGTLEVNGPISGAGTLSGPGNRAGLVILNGANTFGGTLRTENASFRADDGIGLPANALLQFNGNMNSTDGYYNPGNVLETKGTFTRSIGSGAGQVQWNSSNTQYRAGGFAAVGGPLTVSLGGSTAPAAVTWNSGQAQGNLYLQSPNSTHDLTWANPLNPNGTMRIGVLSSTYPANLTGIISGSGTLRITDGGQITLSANNTFAGKVQVYNGQLNVGSLNSVIGGGASSNLGAPTTTDNGTIDLGGNQNITGSPVWNTPTVLATLRYTGAGETTDRVLNVTGFTGGGGLVPVVVDHAGTGLLKFTSGLSVAAGGARSITVQGSTSGTGELSGAIPNASTSTTLNANANLNASQIQIPTSASVGVGDLVTGSGIQADTFVTAVGGGGSQYFVNLSKNTSSAISSGTPLTFTNVTNLTKAGSGTWTLSGTNTFSGTVAVNGGTLEIGGSGSLGSGTYDKAITVASGATLAYASAANQVLSGTLGGAGGLSVAEGSLILAGVATPGSGTTVSGGTLVVDGSLAGSLSVGAAGTLAGSGSLGGSVSIAGLHAPGNSPGIQTFDSNLSYSTGAQVAWELTGNDTTNGSNPSAIYDQVVVGGNLSFSGGTSLSLSFSALGSGVDWANAFWAEDRAWTLYEVGSGTTTGFGNLSLAGSPETWFDAQSVSLLSARPSASFSLEQDGQNVNIIYTAVPEPTGLALAAAGGLAALMIGRRALSARLH